MVESPHVLLRRNEAHPVVPGSSTYRGGGRNLKTGLGFQFSGALSRLLACRWQILRAFLARAGLSRRRSLVAAQCPLAPAAAGRRTVSSYHISGHLGQRDELWRNAFQAFLTGLVGSQILLFANMIAREFPGSAVPSGVTLETISAATFAALVVILLFALIASEKS